MCPNYLPTPVVPQAVKDCYTSNAENITFRRHDHVTQGPMLETDVEQHLGENQVINQRTRPSDASFSQVITISIYPSKKIRAYKLLNQNHPTLSLPDFRILNCTVQTELKQ